MDCTNSQPEKDLFNNPIVSVLIDRIKVTIKVVHNQDNGRRLTLLNDDFKSLHNVTKHKALEYGLYHVFNGDDSEEYIRFIKAWSLKKGREYRVEAEKDVKAPPRKITVKGKTFKYSGQKKVLEHWSYRIYGCEARIIKAKNYLSIELNDVLQKYPHESPYRLIRKVLEYLIKTEVIKFNPKRRTKDSIRRKAYSIIENVHPSEIEIAFDFNADYSRKLRVENERLAALEEFTRCEETVYFNNSFYDSRRWKGKSYNKSLKNRIDNWIKMNRDTYKMKDYVSMLENVPRGIRETVHEDDRYRFEITLGANKLNEYNSRELLKKRSNEMIMNLERSLYIGITKFFDNFDYSFKKQLIEDLKAFIKIDIEDHFGNTTKRNHKKIIKALFCRHLPTDQQMRGRECA